MDYTIADVLKELLSEHQVKVSKVAVIQRLKKDFKEGKDYRKSHVFIITQRTKNKLVSYYKDQNV